MNIFNDLKMSLLNLYQKYYRIVIYRGILIYFIVIVQQNVYIHLLIIYIHKLINELQRIITIQFPQQTHNRPICFIINRLYRYTIVNMLSKIYKYYKEVDGLIQYKFIHVLYKIFSNYHKNLQINNKRKHNIREILNNKS